MVHDCKEVEGWIWFLFYFFFYFFRKNVQILVEQIELMYSDL